MIKEAKKLNIDDLIKQGYVLGPDQVDPETGGITNVVYNIGDFNKDIKNIYDTYRNITKFKGSSNEKIQNLAKKISKDISQTIRDIKELKEYINLIRQTLS